MTQISTAYGWFGKQLVLNVRVNMTFDLESFSEHSGQHVRPEKQPAVETVEKPSVRLIFFDCVTAVTSADFTLFHIPEHM